MVVLLSNHINNTAAIDQGLITPIVFDADLKGLLEINRDINRLSNKAKEGALESHEFQVIYDYNIFNILVCIIYTYTVVLAQKACFFLNINYTLEIKYNNLLFSIIAHFFRIIII